MKVAVIGVGRIGALLEEDRFRRKPCTHLGAWKELGAEIAITDADPARAEKVGTKFKVETKAFEEICEESWDVISVATPVETHLKIIRGYLARSPVKAIFCEKPLAEEPLGASFMLEACKLNNVKLAVNHTRAWDPIYQEVERIIDEKRYGKFIGGTGYYSGDVVNDGCHMAHLANWYGLDDRFQVYNVKNIEYLLFELDLLFETGRVKVLENGNAIEIYEAKPSPNYEFFNELSEVRLGPYDIPGLRQKESLRVETPILRACRQVYESAISSDVQPLCTGVDGLKALERALRWKAATTI